jgi:hypothetical protein
MPRDHTRNRMSRMATPVHPPGAARPARRRRRHAPNPRFRRPRAPAQPSGHRQKSMTTTNPTSDQAPRPRFRRTRGQTPAQPRGLRPFSILCLSSPKWGTCRQSVDNYRKSPNLWTGDLTTRQSPSGKAAVSRVDFTGALGWSAKPSSEAGSANKAGLVTLTTEPVVHNEAVPSYRAGCTSPRHRRLLTSKDATLSGRQGSAKSVPEFGGGSAGSWRRR